MDERIAFNAETLKNVHWIGGSPQHLQVSAQASWSPREAVIVLRNPSDKPQTFLLKIQTELELPLGLRAPRPHKTPGQRVNER